VVLTDATVQAIAEQRPSSRAELARVGGIGAVKLERYGSAILALCRGEEPGETFVADP
jgi:DNA helicase-2/ATP-dependent DNA helicase PcrA